MYSSEYSGCRYGYHLSVRPDPSQENELFLPREVWGLELSSVRIKEIMLLRQLLDTHGILLFKGESQKKVMESESLERLMGVLCEDDGSDTGRRKVRSLGNTKGALFCRTGLEWHSDGVGTNTILSCIQAPKIGGDTLFASSTKMYNRLDPESKIEASKAIVVYSNRFTSGGYSAYDCENGLRMNSTGTRLLRPAQRRLPSWRYWSKTMPLVFTNENGDKFISVDIRKFDHIQGLTVEKSRGKLEDWLLRGLGWCECLRKSKFDPETLLAIDDGGG
mmetsp:Transcript_33970/g.41898  ORF Transcript_33970/g.41898 Transcript_33970/m.41898 type:complete len:276 (-) Transcript_33970:428-1255(-)